MTDDDGAPKRKRRTGGRGARPTLNRDVIVATALAIIDADGLESLSMRKLGAQLGVDPMAVYYHLPNKAALFDGVVEAILSELGQDLISLAAKWKPDDEWSSEVVAVMSTYREVLRRHPYALPVVSTRPVRSPEALASFERILDAYTRAGFDLQSAVFAMTCAVEFTI
ncbi:TetR/AcrR family transcriptional regulator, partial [Kibdelosporangium lantanae]